MKNPLVVGYKGEIGKFILQGLLSYMPKASDIWCIDVNSTEDEVISRIAMSDVIFLCVPIDRTKSWIIRHSKLLKGKTVIEQTSLKGWLKCKDLKPFVSGFKVLSMHILFRPSATPDRSDRLITVIWPLGEVDWNTCGAYDFISLGLNSQTGRSAFNTIEEHDAAMASQQALVHRVILVLDECMKTCYPGTYIGKRVREIANRVSKGDTVLYKIIQSNPLLKKQLQNFDRKMKSFKIEKYMLSGLGTK